MLEQLGARIVDADQLARLAVAPGSEGLRSVVARFGPGMLTEEGHLDRKRLAELVFRDPHERVALEAIVHPIVAELSREAIRAEAAAGARLVVYEIPLLFEIGRAGEFTTIVLAYLRPELQLRRLMERSGLSEVEAQARIAAQMPIDQKRELATWVVDNSGTEEQTRTQVFDLWQKELRFGS